MPALAALYPGLPAAPGLTLPRPCRDGHPHRQERMALGRLCAHVGATHVFEIGTFDGLTAQMLASLPMVERVWTLDLPDGVFPALPIAPADYDYLHQPHTVPLSEKVVELRGDSATFDFTPYVGRCDLVFVMGAHSPEYIRNDLGVAERLRAPGGVVVWHGGTAEPVAWVSDEYELAMLSERMALVLGAKE